MMSDITENIKVFVRQRPQFDLNIAKSDGKQSGITSISKDTTKCSYFSSVNNNVQEFIADQFFVDSTTQSELYEKIAGPLVVSALQGYSGTIFAYGPTSSGKTFTMRGGDGELKGVMPRCIEHLLSSVGDNNQVTLWASYVQIYCENVSDLLTSSSVEQLSIREKGGSVYVEGLSRVQIASIQDLWELLARGDENRNTASTNMNETSSRSHAALMISVLVRDDDVAGANRGTAAAAAVATHKESTLMLVDLAGSERATASEGRDYMRLEEAKAINLSLSALGNCMSALAEGRTHIPYRDSKLTRLLQGCLGGASRTAVIVNVPPGDDPTGETLSALRFASRASKVKVVARVRRCKDFEAMYLEAKKTLDALDRTSGGNRGDGNNDETQRKREKEVQEEQLRQKESTIEQQRTEIDALKSQLLLAQQTARMLNNNTGGLSDASENSTTVSSDSDWLQKLSTLTEQHTAEIVKVNRIHQVKCEQYKNAERQLSAEITSLHDELNNDRQALLTSMQDLRALGEKKTRSESALQGRVEDLLEELAEKRLLIETLQDASSSLQIRLDDSERRNSAATAVMGEMVSREQVKEMEGLFVDTVTKLSARVNFLEAQQTKGPPSGSSQSIAQQQQQQQYTASSQYQTSSNNNSRIKIEPGGKIRAVSLTSGIAANNVGAANGEKSTNQQSSGGQRLPHSSSNDTILSGQNGRSAAASDTGPKNKLW